ncbi:MAG: porin [Blastocatellia bacterium]|nr:porin [Blastocatellia bacterium]
MFSYRTSLLGLGSRFAIAAALALGGPISLANAAPIMSANRSALSDEPGKATDKPAGRELTENKDKEAAKPASPAEVAKVVEALEERIRLLEEKLVRLTEEKAAPRPAVAAVAPTTAAPALPDDVADIKKEIATIKEEVKKDQSSFSNFFRNVEVSGLVDGYYSYNNNKVDMFTQGRAFDVRHNAFSLQLAKVAFERKNSKDSPLGFRIDLGLGETVDRIISVSDSSRNDATKHVLQAYASVVAPIGSGLTLDFGKMYTPIGAEVVDTKDNFNYSRGWLFAYGPYYHAGLRAKYAVNDKVAVSGFLFNGWDNLFENNVGVGKNAGKTVGFQIGLTPNKKFALTQTYLAGPEAPLANVPDISNVNNWRHAADTVATVFVNDKFTLMGNFIYGSDGDNNGVRGKWTGFAGYFKYAFNDHFAFSPRFEVFNDRDGLRTGVAQTVKDITLTQEVKLVNNLLTRIEFRRDFSNQKFFTNAAGAARSNQNTVIFGLSYFFTTRE